MTHIGSPSDQYRLPSPSHRESTQMWRGVTLALIRGACGATPLAPSSSPARVSDLGG
uniref:Uncharacterized protein n=1 Tax=Siphoviridae sp. ctJ0s2 TaxID=2827834 RepID=A0A8S5TE19_9CAUD|nr:MAG TPA: hypothetical protein [Siphoviridae sp. ctJ0s2]